MQKPIEDSLSFWDPVKKNSVRALVAISSRPGVASSPQRHGYEEIGKAIVARKPLAKSFRKREENGL